MKKLDEKLANITKKLDEKSKHVLNLIPLFGLSTLFSNKSLCLVLVIELRPEKKKTLSLRPNPPVFHLRSRLFFRSGRK